MEMASVFLTSNEVEVGVGKGIKYILKVDGCLRIK
jgi:hypothetical protein